MNTGLHTSARRFLFAFLIAVVVAIFTTLGHVALREATGVQAGASVYACSGHSSGGGDC